MPPKKKGTKVPPAKKKAAPAKRPVGRPRKELGTRVSDSNGLLGPLANVGSTKPMPRRIGRDALEQQRARIRYGIDYPGKRFTERMTRALQDSFATGTLPYGVSLRAPADFERPYKTSFAPIAGNPVWPASNTFPTGPAPGAPGASATAFRPSGPSAYFGPSGPDDTNPKRRRLDELQDIMNADPDDPRLLPRRRNRIAAKIPGFDDDGPVAARQARNRENMNILAVKWAEERKRELDELRGQTRDRPPPGEISQQDRPATIRHRIVKPIPRFDDGPAAERQARNRENMNRLAVKWAEERTRELDAMRGQTRDRPPPGEIPQRDRPVVTGLTKAQKEAAARLASSLSQPRQPPQQPQQTLSSSTSGLRDEIARLQERNSDINRALARPRSSTSSDSLAQERDENVNRIRYLLGVTAPPAQQMVVSVPDPVTVSDELRMLEERASILRQQLALKRAGRSLAGAKRELESILERQKELINETAAATPSSEPASASVQQSIPIPGTETQVPLPSDQEMVPFSYVQGMMDAQERLLDRLSIADRVAKASAPPLLDLRQNPKNEDEYSSRALQFITPKGKIALEARTEQTGRDIDREAAELEVPGTRLKTLLEAIQSKVKPDIIKEEKIKFARQAEEAAEAQKLIAQSEKARREGTKGPAVADMRRVAKHVFMPPATARRLNEEADLRVEKSSAVLSEPAETVPGISTGIDDLELPTNILREMAASREYLPGTLARIDAELARRGETEQALRDVLGLSQSATIPPPSNPPEQPNSGAGLQHVTAATFPASKWTTASSLRWLRSNGLHPIRKSTKINGAYSYALQSPVSYSSFNSVNMSHKNKDFTIVYGTPK